MRNCALRSLFGLDRDSLLTGEIVTLVDKDCGRCQ